MSKSDDNTNELESYGVWVKNSAGEDAAPKAEATDTSDELNLDDGNLDLPDFDDSDFSDMFKDDPQTEEAADDFGSEDDTTLSIDELANITDSVAVEQVEAEGEDISDDDFAIGADTPAETTEEPAAEPETEEVSFDIDEADNSDSGEEEELSLDDFMDEGFSDESVAAGNNGYEAGAEPAAASSETEELSLDDFMDGDSFESAPETPKEEEIEDEAPLDMDINFDDSADSVETEDNVSLDISSDDDFDDSTEETEETIETEEVLMDDFGSSFTATEDKPAASDENISTEDVDLSDFGIDADAEETPNSGA